EGSCRKRPTFQPTSTANNNQNRQINRPHVLRQRTDGNEIHPSRRKRRYRFESDTARYFESSFSVHFRDRTSDVIKRKLIEHHAIGTRDERFAQFVEILHFDFQ